MIFRFVIRNLAVLPKCALPTTTLLQTHPYTQSNSRTSYAFSTKSPKETQDQPAATPAQEAPVKRAKKVVNKVETDETKVKTQNEKIEKKPNEVDAKQGQKPERRSKIVVISSEQQLKELTQKASKSSQLYPLLHAYMSSHLIFSNSTIDQLFLKLASLPITSLHTGIDILSHHQLISYTPSPSVIHALLTKTETSEGAYNKILSLLTGSPSVELSKETIEKLMNQLKAKSKQIRFWWIVKLLVTRQKHLKLGNIDLLNMFAAGLEYRISQKLYAVSRKDQVISEWITSAHQTIPNTQDAHFSAAIFCLSNSLPALFAEHLLKLTDQEKIVKTLLYLEECPEDYRLSTVGHLKQLNISEDLRARLSEFKQVKFNPSQVESE